MRKKNLTPFVVFSVFITPLILIAYQNCSEYNPGTTTNFTNYLESTATPLYTDNLFESLNYSSNSCTPEPLTPKEILYNKKEHICALAEDSCQKDFLIKDSYITLEASSNTCDEANDINEIIPENDFKWIDLSSSGYKKSDFGNLCSFQFQTLINIKKRLCGAGSNGCKISFLKQEGFTKDSLNICSEVPQD